MIEHAELVAEPIGERDHSDWVFSLANHNMRRQTKWRKQVVSESGVKMVSAALYICNRSL